MRVFGAKQAFRDKEEVGELAELHQNKEKTPTMGGLLICSTVLISVLLWAEPNVYVVAALSTYLLLTIVGFADDYLKISQKNSKGLLGIYKLFGHFFATAAALYILLGPLSEILTGTDGNATGSAQKMRELWLPFFKECLSAFLKIIGGE